MAHSTQTLKPCNSTVCEGAQIGGHFQGRLWALRALVGIVTVGQIAALILMTEVPARAYVDPGTGLLTLQMLGASVAGVLFMIRRKLRSFFTKSEGSLARPSVDTFDAPGGPRKG